MTNFTECSNCSDLKQLNCKAARNALQTGFAMTEKCDPEFAAKARENIVNKVAASISNLGCAYSNLELVDYLGK